MQLRHAFGGTERNGDGPAALAIRGLHVEEPCELRRVEGVSILPELAMERIAGSECGDMNVGRRAAQFDQRDGRSQARADAVHQQRGIALQEERRVGRFTDNVDSVSLSSSLNSPNTWRMSSSRRTSRRDG